MTIKARWRQFRCKHTPMYRAWRDKPEIRRPGWGCRCTLCGKKAR